MKPCYCRVPGQQRKCIFELTLKLCFDLRFNTNTFHFSTEQIRFCCLWKRLKNKLLLPLQSTLQNVVLFYFFNLKGTIVNCFLPCLSRWWRLMFFQPTVWRLISRDMMWSCPALASRPPFFLQSPATLCPWLLW